MGLDMFLSRKTVFTPMKDNIGIEKEEVVKEKQKHLGGLSGFGIYPNKVCGILEEVGYWRKDFQIHNWFVNNVQEGNDDCKQHTVHIEDLMELKQICNEVLNDHSKKDDLLPLSDYDEDYFIGLKHTIEIINEIISDETEIEKHRSEHIGLGCFHLYYYQSSW
jgi:hypothetical protein|tara:strand:- start:32 stop:520 length:489 start_codon:yes stop_codon:yes gene_type:complete